MKKILITLSILIVSITSFSQDEVEIPKGTNKIKLKTELNERENVKLILKVLKENDFDFNQSISNNKSQFNKLLKTQNSD